jgi:hypothetical protein
VEGRKEDPRTFHDSLLHGEPSGEQEKLTPPNAVVK